MGYIDEMAEAYVPEEMGIFRNKLWQQTYLSLSPQLTYQLRWTPPDGVLSYGWDISTQPKYFQWCDEFHALCVQRNIPWHNAIAFWHSLLEAKDGPSDFDPFTRYRLILGGTCHYGDFFLFALIKHVPQDFVWPDDLPPEVRKKYLEQIQAQIAQQKTSIPERTQSLNGLEDFSRKWNEHLAAAKKCQQWRSNYEKVNKRKSEWMSDDTQSNDQIVSLARIFKQYISLLNKYKNSKHLDFQKAWDEFENKGTREDSCLYYSFARIVYWLKESQEIALIAPIYVLALFRERTAKLYRNNKESFGYIDNLSAAAILHSADANFYEDTQINTRSRRDAQLVIYRVLCGYFHKNTGLLCTFFAPDLCDYMLQTVLPLVDQQ